MVEYFQSEGDPPPLRTSFPPPDRREELRPPLLVSPSLPDPWVLDQSLSMRDRWESLRCPSKNKPDWVAVGLANDGFKITWEHEPPMSYKWAPPAAIVTSAENAAILALKVMSWVQRENVTDVDSLIPGEMHFGRLFYVPKKGGGIHPILDFSFLNTFIQTPKLKMEAVSSIFPYLVQGMFATSLDVTHHFVSQG